MGGKRIDPQTKRKVAELYAKLANAREVGRKLDISESTVRAIIGQERIARYRAAHTRAVESAIRKGRKSLSRNVDLVNRYLAKHATDAEGIPDLEPKDVASLLTAQSNLVERLLKIDERGESRRMARLSRELRRKEIEIAALRIANGGIEKHEVSVAPDDAREALAAVLATRGRGDEPK